jgi:hypothetical protein
MLLRDIWDLFSLGQFDPKKRLIPVSSTHCTPKLKILAEKMTGNVTK